MMSRAAARRAESLVAKELGLIRVPGRSRAVRGRTTAGPSRLAPSGVRSHMTDAPTVRPYQEDAKPYQAHYGQPAPDLSHQQLRLTVIQARARRSPTLSRSSLRLWKAGRSHSADGSSRSGESDYPTCDTLLRPCQACIREPTLLHTARLNRTGPARVPRRGLRQAPHGHPARVRYSDQRRGQSQEAEIQGICNRDVCEPPAQSSPAGQADLEVGRRRGRGGDRQCHAA